MIYKNLWQFWKWLMLIWRDTKKVVTFRDLEELNSETLSRNYFLKQKLHRGNSGWRINMTSNLYYDPAKPSAFATLKKLQEAARESMLGKKPGEILSWLEKQNTYTLHRPLRRKFPRNPYTVNNLFDVWECDLIDVQAFRKFNDNYKFLLTVVDVFSKYLHIVPLKLVQR